MAFVYDRLVVGTELLCQSGGYLLDNARASIITADGATSVSLPPPEKDGMVLTADVSDVNSASGLAWKAIDPASLDLSSLAGSGLSYQDSNLAIKPSETIKTIDGAVSVASDISSGHPLLSTGSATSAPKYGALDLASTGVTGVVPVARGGTGMSSLPLSSVLTTDSKGGVSGIDLSSLLPTTATMTTTQSSLLASTVLLSFPVAKGFLHYITANIISVGAAGKSSPQASFTIRTTVDYTDGSSRTVGVDTSYAPVLTGQKVAVRSDESAVTFLVGGSIANWKIRVDPILSQAPMA